MKIFKIRPKTVFEKLKNFIKNEARSKGFSSVILGLSGGLDSTVVAYLATHALGKRCVRSIIMPYGRLSDGPTLHAKRIAKELGINAELIDISPMVDAYFKKVNCNDNIRRGNKMARERMSILYDQSKKYNSLVIGTSNKTERILGYGTLYGDSACAINPIGNLYKTQLRELARYLDVPSYILDKPPSADLWEGQTDEDEIGHKYEEIDRLLFFMIDMRISQKRLLEKGFSSKMIADISSRIKTNKFKSELPSIASI